MNEQTRCRRCIDAWFFIFSTTHTTCECFSTKNIQYQFTPRESCPLPTQRPRTLHIDTCVNQRVVTRRGKCEKRNKRGRCACPTDLLICFLNLLPPPLIRSFLFEKSIDEVEPVVVVEPVVAERDVAGRHRKYAPCPPARVWSRMGRKPCAFHSDIYHQRALIPLDSPSTCGLWFVERANLQIPFGRVCTF